MKTTLRISLILNLALFAGLIFVLGNQHQRAVTPPPGLLKSRPPAPAAAPSRSAKPEPQSAPFRWSQLEAAKSYRAYIANLRAIGCPEPTIEDIVRGDTDRAFSWERNQLKLDGSGTGPWSRARERQLVASLLGGQASTTETVASVPRATKVEPGNGSDDATGTVALARSAANPVPPDSGSSVVAKTSVPRLDTGTSAPSYPLFLQNVNWSALGFTANQRTVIAQVRQQFENTMANGTQNPGEVASQNANAAGPNGTSPNFNSGASPGLMRWHQAIQIANQQLRDQMGAQAYLAYEQEQYYAWYQPQVLAAAASGKPLVINPEAFSLK